MGKKLASKIFGGALCALAAASIAATAHANTTLIVGTGWVNDQADAQNTPTEDSTVSFTVGAGQTDIFSLSDCCTAGDVWQVVINGTITADSVFAVLPTNFPTGLGFTLDDTYWTDPTLSHLQLTFGPGTYNLVISDISDIAYPAGVGYRLDTVAIPEPTTWSLLIGGLGLAGFALRRRYRTAKAA